MVVGFFSPTWAARRRVGGGRAVGGLSRRQGCARQPFSQPRPLVFLCGFRLENVRRGNGLAWKRLAVVGPRGRGGAGRGGRGGVVGTRAFGVPTPGAVLGHELCWSPHPRILVDMRDAVVSWWCMRRVQLFDVQKQK